MSTSEIAEGEVNMHKGNASGAFLVMMLNLPYKNSVGI